jgi:aspartyl-tRNA(Asn)/glutamyl-tRNA(Gln) amidotransferase subunit A
VALDGCFPLAPGFDHAGPMGRDVETCARMLEALAPDFDRAELGSLDELEVGVAWLEFAEPLVRARVEAAAELFPHRRGVAFPLPEEVGPVFMREVAESHHGLFPEHADAYGDNVRAKLERCVSVTDAEFGAALRRLEEYRQRAAEAIEGVDLLLTPTLAFVAPPALRDDLEIRDAVIRLTFPFNALGWPALALPCGTGAALWHGRARASRLGAARRACRRGRARNRRRLPARAGAGSAVSRNARDLRSAR